MADMPHWTELGLRGFRSLSARTRLTEYSPISAALLEARLPSSTKPHVGITTDGAPVSGLAPIHASGVSTAPIVHAAQAFLGALTVAQRDEVLFPLGATEQRLWLNMHPNYLRHGLMLEALGSDAQGVDARGVDAQGVDARSVDARAAAMGLMAACLSDRGFQQARDVMRVNGLLVEITNSADEFGEWPYWISFFGEPSTTEPWAWQIDGHHLNLNVFVLGDHMVFTPSFMGSEPCDIEDGLLAGVHLFRPEHDAGLAFLRSLNNTQLAAAVFSPSIARDALPPELHDPIDGRMQVGALNDNRILPYEGVRGGSLDTSQRQLLRNLIGEYVGWGSTGHAEVKMAEVEAHLDNTHVLWMGRIAEHGPFYYRVHSPVVLIEFDHHPGIVFNNIEPSHHHTHTLIRTPNAGDYGTDLLREHHHRYDHTRGTHERRA
jgi:hypothetical protein